MYLKSFIFAICFRNKNEDIYSVFQVWQFIQQAHRFEAANPILFGSLTIFFTICPIIVYIILDIICYMKNGRFQRGKFGFLWELPLVKVTKYWEYLEELGTITKQKKDLGLLKKEWTLKSVNFDTVIEVKDWQLEEVLTRFSEMDLSEQSYMTLEELWKSSHEGMFTGCLSNEVSLQLEDSKQKLNDKMSSFDLKLSVTKVLETFFENGPQFVLQLSILVASSDGPSIEDLGTYIAEEPWLAAIKILKLLISFVSLLIGTSGIFKNLPHIEIYHQMPTMPQYSWKSCFVVFPCLTMTIGPRLWSMAIFLGTVHLRHYAIAACNFFVCILVYIICFFSLTFPYYRKLRTNDNVSKYQTNLTKAFLSSMMSPCVVINPKTKNLLFSDIASSLAHLVLLLFLIFSTPNLTDPSKETYNFYFEHVCYTLIGLIVLSPIFSIILHFYSKPKFHWPSFMCNENHSQHSREDLKLKELSCGDARVTSEKNESTVDIEDATLP